MFGPSLSVNGPGAALIDSHLIAATRLILAISALLIVDYTAMPHFDGDVSRMVLMLYIAYSAVLYLSSVRRNPLERSVSRWAHWTDIGWFTLLLFLSGGTNSIFFFGYLFAILVASFGWGFKSGLFATAVSACLYVTGSVLGSVAGGIGTQGLELSRFLVRLLYLVVLGYLMAHWGGLKTKLNRQLTLLREITSISPPRLGITNLISSTLAQLRAFYDADSCLLLLDEPDKSQYSLHRLKREDSTGATETSAVPAEMLQLLLGPAPDHAIVFSEDLRGWRRLNYTYDATTNEQVSNEGDENRMLAAFLDARSFISVPLLHQNRRLGRLYLTSTRRRAFETSDAGFLIQIADHLIPVIDSIRLVDRLATEAAEEERKRIARDIHDSIIQPYIGLQMGLAGVRQKLALDEVDRGGDVQHSLARLRDAAADTDRLIEMTADGITDLRRYVSGLRPAGDGEGSLMSSIRRFAEKFSQATNIAVQIRADGALNVNERLAAEIFQMIVEGLSNIRRHTASARAFIGLESSDTRITLRIENDGTRGSPAKPFSPQSITERAEALGGKVSVETFGDVGTSVIVEMPF